MPPITIAPSSEAGRAVASGDHARRMQDAKDARAAARAGLNELAAKKAAAALNSPQDAPLFDDAPAAAPTKPSATFTIHALMDDFPFEVSFAGSADQLAATVQRLRDLGAVPPTPAARAAVEAEKERSAPVCKCDACDRYGTPMKESTKKPGSWYCSGRTGQKAGQPVYCRETA